MASLHLLDTAINVVKFLIEAPAISGALTRKANALGKEILDSSDVSENLANRIADALHGKNVVNFDFRRRGDGKWVLLAHRNAAESQVAKVEAPEKDAWVDSLDTGAKGNHKCPQCIGTGRYVTGLENGQPKFGHGICYRCKGKGYTTAVDRRRNSSYQEHALNKAIRADMGGA
jgi:DnaJ-class molecular chaperone